MRKNNQSCKRPGPEYWFIQRVKQKTYHKILDVDNESLQKSAMTSINLVNFT